MTNKAESYFRLAQILATLAGFFIIASSMFFAIASSNREIAYNLFIDIAQKREELMDNPIQSTDPEYLVERFKPLSTEELSILELLNAHDRYSIVGVGFFAMGIAFIATSLKSWQVGHRITSQKRFK